ncbi:hypothetical protein D3C80_1610290 [compost metagenome]
MNTLQKYKKTDLFSISACQSSNSSLASFWFIHNGEHQKVKSVKGVGRTEQVGYLALLREQIWCFLAAKYR